MISKLQLQSLISKYHLGGLIESVKWTIQDSKLLIRATTLNQNVLCEVECVDFPLENCGLAIYETSQLNRLINITSGDLDLNVQKIHQLPIKLLIDDLNYSLFYALADIAIIPKIPNVIVVPYHVVINLEGEKINAIIRAKNALTESNTVLIESSKTLEGVSSVDFKFGEIDEHNNKIYYTISENINIEKDISLPFNTDLLKEILSANKNCEEGKIEISDNGIMKLIFKEGNIRSKYHVTRKAEF